MRVEQRETPIPATLGRHALVWAERRRGDVPRHRADVFRRPPGERS